jgi:hypothetical protein
MRKGMMLIGLLLLTACAPAIPTTCSTKDCFITVANACKDMNMTLTETAGTFTYASTSKCVFTKTLVTPNPQETQEMKTLLTGKSLSCNYAQGKFDARWVNSLIFGMEYCTGDLKTVLGEMLAFG